MISLMTMGKAAAFISVGGFISLAGYDFHRGSDQNFSIKSLENKDDAIMRYMHESESRLSSQIQKLHVNVLTEISSKEKACEVLQASIESAKYSHKYCKE